MLAIEIKERDQAVDVIVPEAMTEEKPCELGCRQGQDNYGETP